MSVRKLIFGGSGRRHAAIFILYCLAFAAVTRQVFHFVALPAGLAVMVASVAGSGCGLLGARLAEFFPMEITRDTFQWRFLVIGLLIVLSFQTLAHFPGEETGVWVWDLPFLISCLLAVAIRAILRTREARKRN